MSVDKAAWYDETRERADRCVALLDEKNPGWWAGVRENELNFNSLFKCVLGQCYGTIMAGSNLLGINVLYEEDDEKDWYYFGIDTRLSLDTELRQHAERLKTVWSDIIKERRSKKNEGV